MKRMIMMPAIAGMLLLTGCYECETIETRIVLHASGSPQATVLLEYDNISSGEAKQEDVKGDFDELLKDWQDDQYLLDRAEEGLVVKNRELFIRDGKIVGRVTGIMKDLGDIYKLWSIEGERIMLVDDMGGDYKLVETNGNILKTDKNTLIVWPEDATELRWVLRQPADSMSESFEKNRPLMLKMLQEHLARQKKTG